MSSLPPLSGGASGSPQAAGSETLHVHYAWILKTVDPYLVSRHVSHTSLGQRISLQKRLREVMSAGNAGSSGRDEIVVAVTKEDEVESSWDSFTERLVRSVRC